MIIQMEHKGEFFCMGRDPQDYPVEFRDRHGNHVIMTVDFMYMVVKLIAGAKGLKLND